MSRPDIAPTAARVLLLASRDGGVSRSEAAQACGVALHQANYVLTLALECGLVRCVGRFRGRRYFAERPVHDAGQALAAWRAAKPVLRPSPSLPPQVGRGRPGAAALLDPRAPALVPAHVTVTVCPGHRGDPRWTVTAEPGWTGQITADWHAGRRPI